MDLKCLIFLLGCGQKWNMLIDNGILHIDLYNGADNMRRRQLCCVCISRASYAWSRFVLDILYVVSIASMYDFIYKYVKQGVIVIF